MRTRRQAQGAGSRAARLASLLGLVVFIGAGVAQGQVPGQMNFQGLLLDAAGQPKNGSVTLGFGLYEDPSGGSALWTETHANVAVTDGIYDVALGSTTPLTPEVFSSASRWLEITVDGEVLSPRRQLLVVPYAIRSETANTASNALNVGGISADFVVHLWQHTDSDNSGPVNSDPTEGFADPDGDGVANFADADNDDDGLSDGAEGSQSSDLNLVTPTVTSVSPTSQPEQTTGTVSVTGTNFDEPGFAVVFGSQTPTPTNVTPTSFDVSVGPQPAGTVPVVVSLGNGEMAQGSFVFFTVAQYVTAFVTSTTYDGNLGGVSGADAKCQERASAAGLPGTYRAWIRGGVTSNVWPPNSVFVLSSDVLFASTFSILVTSPYHTPRLNLDEFGLAQLGYAWTGGGSALPGGGATCNGWASSSSSATGHRGALTGAGDWENFGMANCDTLLHLYCFEQ